MKFKMILLLFCAPLFVGCAHIATYQGLQEMQKTFDGFMGCSEEEVVMKLGIPKNLQEIGKLKIYQYHKSYGTRTNAYANTYGASAFGNANVWESYDDAEIIFKDGYAVSWKGSVQR